jgi:N-acetylmuramoyl-L-alanine amidase
MRKIIVSAGHSAKTGAGRDNGAASPYGIEGVEADIFRDLVVKELQNLGVNTVTDGDDTILADSIGTFKKIATEEDILVEWHFNSASPAATGTEVLIPDANTVLEKEIASKIANEISITLGIKNRGVKTEADSARGKLGWMRQLPGSNILPEICFISNKSDMEKYQTNKTKLAKNIANILASYVKKVSNKECYYIVVSGDTLSKIAAKEKTTVEKLKKDNNLKSDLIQVGQKLKL